MPAPTHPRPYTETLANGLRVTLRQVPGLTRSAAVLRVAAGSHDVPLAWPGMAHFLEHLLFLGTERFPAQQGLMAYVQRHGGQVNASTRERTTDFFVELPTASFSEGLERLSDMLAHPCMNPDNQLREREVLHAEFIAWSQDAAAQQQQALYAGLAADHPLRGFHAGNRDSLPVPQAAFQQALKDFHQRFYRTGQMTLSLVGPQNLDALQALARQFAAALPVGDNVVQAAPVPLMAGSAKSYQQAGEGRLHQLFALEDLPDGSADAMAFLCHWLNSAKPGGLLAHLRHQGLAQGLKAEPLYRFGGQALLHVQFIAPAAGAQTLVEALHDWLSFFAAQRDWPALRQEYATLLQRRQQVSGALQSARADSEQSESGLSDAGAAALGQLLRQLGVVDNFSERWHLPAANPFLREAPPLANANLIRGQTSAHRGLRTFAQDRSRSRRERSAMQFSQALPDTGVEGAVYVRWVLASTPAEDLPARLQRALQDVSEDARQAGVDLSFAATGNQWQLKLTGLQEPMPAVLESALQTLTQTDAPVPPAEPEKPLMPIRQLLQALPEQGRESAGTTDDAAHLWTTARWDGLALGLNARTQSAMGLALSRIPGTADSQLPPLPVINGERLWTHLDTASSEHALLLFCPAASQGLDDEAAWRLLAHIGQTPFYQRLRVELQLGYAVFSGIRSVHGQTGLLFGVQSPNVAPVELLEHIRQFMDALTALVASLDEQAFLQQRQALAEQFDVNGLALKDAAELLWQARLAGHPSDYLTQLAAAIERLEPRALTAAAQRLSNAEGGWRCLASSPSPGSPWRMAQ